MRHDHEDVQGVNRLLAQERHVAIQYRLKGPLLALDFVLLPKVRHLTKHQVPGVDRRNPTIHLPTGRGRSLRPDVSLAHELVDAAAMRLIRSPADYDVIVTENLFGDILSDEASVLAGSIGMLPSASLGDGKLGLYEPIHGSAPDIAGRGIADPYGTILSVAMLLRYSLRAEEAAKAIERAVTDAIDAGVVPGDLGGKATTVECGTAVVERIH